MTLLGIILILLGIGAVIIAGAAQKRFPRLQGVMRGLLVTYVTTMLILTGAELYLRYVYADSGWLWTRAGENWHRRYVHNNSLGFRDREWTPADYEGKTKVFVIGDSFTQGFGIENPEDRYANVLARLLGTDYAVFNLGIPDTSTRDQIQTLANYPVPDPDIIVWQYFLNDINDAGLSIGDHWWPTMPLERPPFVEQSHLANLIYWRMAPFFTTVDVTDNNTYWDWAFYAYDNSVIWGIHQQEIRQQLDQIEALGARLVVIIFPNPLDPVGSVPYVDRVAQYFESQGVMDVMRLYHDIAFFATHRDEDLVVSPRDAHPSAAFNAYLGQRIYDTFFAGQTAGAAD